MAKKATTLDVSLAFKGLKDLSKDLDSTFQRAAMNSGFKDLNKEAKAYIKSIQKLEGKDRYEAITKRFKVLAKTNKNIGTLIEYGNTLGVAFGIAEDEVARLNMQLVKSSINAEDYMKSMQEAVKESYLGEMERLSAEQQAARLGFGKKTINYIKGKLGSIRDTYEGIMSFAQRHPLLGGFILIKAIDTLIDKFKESGKIIVETSKLAAKYGNDFNKSMKEFVNTSISVKEAVPLAEFEQILPLMTKLGQEGITNQKKIKDLSIGLSKAAYFLGDDITMAIIPAVAKLGDSFTTIDEGLGFINKAFGEFSGEMAVGIANLAKASGTSFNKLAKSSSQVTNGLKAIGMSAESAKELVQTLTSTDIRKIPDIFKPFYSQIRKGDFKGVNKVIGNMLPMIKSIPEGFEASVAESLGMTEQQILDLKSNLATMSPEKAIAQLNKEMKAKALPITDQYANATSNVVSALDRLTERIGLVGTDFGTNLASGPIGKMFANLFDTLGEHVGLTIAGTVATFLAGKGAMKLAGGGLSVLKNMMPNAGMLGKIGNFMTKERSFLGKGAQIASTVENVTPAISKLPSLNFLKGGGKLLKGAGIFGGLLGAGLSAADLMNGNATGGSIGGAAGSTAGGALGGLAGSLLGPMGTALGGIAGSYMGENIGSWIGEKFEGETGQGISSGIGSTLLSDALNKQYETQSVQEQLLQEIKSILTATYQVDQRMLQEELGKSDYTEFMAIQAVASDMRGIDNNKTPVR